MVNVALDAMGGDHAPKAAIQGALDAVSSMDVCINLTGPKLVIEKTLKELGVSKPHPKLKIVDAPDIIEMAESPSLAFKQKKNSSIHLGLGLLKDKSVDGFVSAGNTGAVMAVATFVLGRIPGVERPAIASVWPTKSGQVLLLDLGATMDCKPKYLEQFAVMGKFYSQLILGVSEPRVGLINIGEEPDKGDQLALATHQALSHSPNIKFVGNVEAKDIFNNEADVVVCDGFVGNNILKMAEGITDFFTSYFKKACKRSVLGMIGIAFLLPIIKRFKKDTDYDEFGGAPLLGVNGICMISHGKSSPKAIKNAIKNVVSAKESQMIDKIGHALANTSKKESFEAGALKTSKNNPVSL